MAEERNRGSWDMSVKVTLAGLMLTMLVGMFSLYGEGVEIKEQAKDNTETISELKIELKRIEEKKASKAEMERMFDEYQEKIVARIEYSDKVSEIQLKNILKTLERIEKKQEKEEEKEEE